MSALTSKMKRWLPGLLIIGGIGLAGAGWHHFTSTPEGILLKYSLRERRGSEGAINSQKLRDELIACGEPAIPVMIREIRKGWWTRGRTCFPAVLKGLGAKASAELLSAIDNERDPLARINLVTALFHAFGDASRLEVAISDIGKDLVPEFAANRFASFLRVQLPENAPALLKDEKLNPDFRPWLENYQARVANQ